MDSKLIEIWSADVHVGPPHNSKLLKDIPVKKVPRHFLLNDSDFVKRIAKIAFDNMVLPKYCYNPEGVPYILIIYNKPVGNVNDSFSDIIY